MDGSEPEPRTCAQGRGPCIVGVLSPRVETVNCPRCGKKTTPGSSKCTWCGLELVKSENEPAAPAAPAAPMPRLQGTMHMPAATPPAPPPPAPPPPAIAELPPRVSAGQPPRRSGPPMEPVFGAPAATKKSPLAMIVVVLVILAIGGGAFLMFGRGKAAAPTPARDTT